MRALVERTGLRRVCVAGGDTCGHALSQLGIYALEVLCPVAPGSPICRSHAHEAAFDDLEISLKAGQVGKPSYFGFIREGREPDADH
jgi:3-oxoisoapionate kinase